MANRISAGHRIPGGMAYVFPTCGVGAPTSASLTFQNAGGDNIGAILDNVSLDEDSPSNFPVETPEPASIAMLALGLAGLGIARKRSLR